MNLTPREKDKLLVAMAANVARRRLEHPRQRACGGGSAAAGGLPLPSSTAVRKPRAYRGAARRR